MTVTTLAAAADRGDDEARSVLGDMVLDSVRYAAAALAGCLDGGEGDDPELAASLTGGRSYAELRAMVLLLADCADKARVTAACGINPGLAAGNARRIAEARHNAAEYAWLRDGRVCPAEAARRVGLTSRGAASDYEAAYQAQRGARHAAVA